MRPERCLNIDIPLQVTKGEAVVIEVQIENTGTQPQLLDGIDITPGYLEGIGIQRTDPPFIESYPLFLFDWQSYTFQQNIPPGETIIVQFLGMGLKSGDFSGEIDVCINSESTCTTFIARTVVVD